jgi:hypothetical protein
MEDGRMKAKAMIKRLEELVKEHGDKEVTLTAEWGVSPALLIAPYDKDGRGIGDPGFKKIAKFHIH